MKIVSVPCSYLKNCKKMIVADQYFILLTGRSVLILTKEMELVKQIDGFQYVYDGKLSPDGTKLLLISNGANFYMLSLDRLELLWKARVKEGKYCNLEGRGIWTLDGTRFLFVIFDQKTIQYKIRSYNALDPNDSYDETTLSKSHRIHEILTIPSQNAYVLLVQDILDTQFNLPSRPLKLLVYQSGICQEFVLHSKKGIPLGMDYQEYLNKLVIYTDEETFSCNLNGENISKISLDDPDKSSSLNPFAYYGMTQIKQIAASQNGQYVFIASTYGFDICGKDSGDVLFSKEYGFGAENFTEIKENLIVVCQYTGKASMYKIQ